MRSSLVVLSLAVCVCSSLLPAAPREKLDRGLVAVRAGEGKVYLSWRWFGDESARTTFDVYRRAGDGPETHLNKQPIAKTTDFLDASAPTDKELTYTVRPVVSGDARPGPVGQTTYKPGQGEGCLVLPLKGDYRFQKFAPADLDGDGQLDYVIKQPGDNVDPWYKYWKKSPDTYKLEAYRADGTHLWTYDMGWAIERGIWYSPYVVWDLDGDGKAEVVCKASEGDPRDAEGKVQSGPEYILVLGGATGKEIARANWPARELFASQGQHAYNYASRNQLAVAYLDGQRPSLIVNRGTYNIIIIEAYDLREGKLVPRWKWSNQKLDRKYWGQGAHWMHAADVDGDGKDEVLFGSACLDDDGKEMWSTGLGHPDHLYVGDLDPRRGGLEIYYGVEARQKAANGMCMVDARTGKILWGHQGATRHVHSYGMCSDIDPEHPGAECYSADTDEKKAAAWARLHSSDGKVLSKEMPWRFGPRVAYWDADPQRELVTGGHGGGQVAKYKAKTKLIQYQGNVVAVADILGDWREELITTREGELRIYVSTIPATDSRVTLLADPLYRMDTVVGAMGYYQVPMLSYDMATKTGTRD
ncbi:MAG: Rhamnogalacturonan endolyase YesW precursor [Planctomycetes bacterium ADurb.Bin126]|nr:MAG: Rhamnogalacturonan endolyase YesW precursor [Planctomycetes bacterium ADurb.Bin126]HOD81223.1 silent information regulator protein Sir2 [Phycisphaerae bacterium]HQL71787.1 silent information regulator protein Sir2 [Phycisphaerae bacterium]